MKKNTRVSTAEDTLKIIQNGFFIAPNGDKISIAAAQTAAIAQTVVYKSTDLDNLLEKSFQHNHFKTFFEVTGETSLDAVRRLLDDEGESNVLCLNFASARNAGGGFLTGAQAQEESIARATGLYPCLLKAMQDYYELHRQMKSCVYTDTMIYSPNVPIFKTESGSNLDGLQKVSLITSAAVNAGVVIQREPNNIPLIESFMRQRINKVLVLAQERGHEVLVLGAWGCGVFQNDPEKVALWFKEALETRFAHCFKRIVFAVYSNNPKFITPFQHYFGKF
ncbi:MAG: hypothetical protein RL757_48 [Bacteroidota bacterium]